MATKTISLNLSAYEKLRRARRYPEESFSQVVLRASWPEETITAGELLNRLESTQPFFTGRELDIIERLKSANGTPEDKWKTH